MKNENFGLTGKIQQWRNSLEKYKVENEEFIILNSGLSKYRNLRVFLISLPSTNNNNRTAEIFVYDIIVPKKQTVTTLSKKAESIKQLKADLNVLSEQEKDELKDEMIRQDAFLNNPFYYADVQDLLTDLNFKNYLQTVFSTIHNSSGTVINTFLDLDSRENNIFACGSENLPESLKTIEQITRNMQIPHLFYSTVKHILDKQTSMPLQLENFAETKEFFEGLDPVIQQKTQVSPIKTQTANGKYKEDENNQIEPIRKIRFAKSLNKNPLRCKSTNKILATLPVLPQRYIIDKRNFKIPSLRHVFLNTRYNIIVI